MRTESVTPPAFRPGLLLDEHRAAAAASRETAQQYAREHLRLDFADAQHWRALAGAAGVRLPAWYVPSTPSGVRKFCGRLGLSLADLEAMSGCCTYREFATMNPAWPMFAVVGLLLEVHAERAATTLH